MTGSDLPSQSPSTGPASQHGVRSTSPFPTLAAAPLRDVQKCLPALPRWRSLTQIRRPDHARWTARVERRLSLGCASPNTRGSQGAPASDDAAGATDCENSGSGNIANDSECGSVTSAFQTQPSHNTSVVDLRPAAAAAAAAAVVLRKKRFFLSTAVRPLSGAGLLATTTRRVLFLGLWLPILLLCFYFLAETLQSTSTQSRRSEPAAERQRQKRGFGLAFNANPHVSAANHSEPDIPYETALWYARWPLTEKGKIELLNRWKRNSRPGVLPPLMHYAVTMRNDSHFRIGRDSKAALNNTAVLELVYEMFMHGWTSYLNFAFPNDDLAPLSCEGINTHLSTYLTLIDAADTLAVMGDITGFRLALSEVMKIKNFDIDNKVSVFETNIRLLGGLISLHVQARDWVFDDDAAAKMLSLAVDAADRLILAYDTPTGLPFGSINLRYGVPPDEITLVCTACVGSMTMEFGYLTFLTNDTKYYKAAKRAVLEIWKRRSNIDLLGKFICVKTGTWTSFESGISESIDSFYEYLWKAHLLFGDNDMLNIFHKAYSAIERYSLTNGWYVDIFMSSGSTSRSTFSSLSSFWPGMQISLGHLERAARTTSYITRILSKLPLLPELIRIVNESQLYVANTDSPLRPELIESVYFLSRAFPEESGLREFGFEYALRILRVTATPCGFAGLKNVFDLTLVNHMESFFLSETLKYLFLLFDTDNEISVRPWVFTTEAHPLPVLDSDQRKILARAMDDYEKLTYFSYFNQQAQAAQPSTEEIKNPALPKVKDLINNTIIEGFLSTRNYRDFKPYRDKPAHVAMKDDGTPVRPMEPPCWKYDYSNGMCDANQHKSLQSYFAFSSKGATGFDWLHSGALDKDFSFCRGQFMTNA